MTESQRSRRGLSRRRLFESGALATLGGLLAACGASSSGGEPGRVGSAPPVSAQPTVELTDAVILRTLTSMELLHLDLYQKVTDSGALDARGQALIDRFVEDHRAAAGELLTLTESAGGEPYVCTNDWYERRVVPEILAAVTGDPESDVPASDDPAADLLRISYGFETMMSSSYQKMIELVEDIGLRPPLARLGAVAARHAAAVAMLVSGTPEGYVSPVVLGGELTPEEGERAELFAIPFRFGMLTSTEIVIGAPDSAGTRSGFALETPADNAYVYDYYTCQT